MTATQYVVWFILQAVVTAAILAVGTLAAAGLLHRPRLHQHRAARPADGQAMPAAGVARRGRTAALGRPRAAIHRPHRHSAA